MAEANEKLAASLAVLRELQVGGARVFPSATLTRTHRERLVRHGFLREVVKGWWIAASPATRPGDSTPWYATFWEFCAAYCAERYGTRWHLSAEHSLLRIVGSNTIPTQVVVHAVGANNRQLVLPFETSLFAVRRDAMPPNGEIVEIDGLRLLDPALSLTRVTDAFFQTRPLEAQLALGQLSDVSDVLRHLLEGGHARVAGRIAGALRRVGRPADADEIVATMRAAEHDVRERDPFEPTIDVLEFTASVPPIVARVRALWYQHRQAVIDRFPAAPGLPADPTEFLAAVDDAYASDAYHSLSIEGYAVSAELIERVRTRGWDPDADDDDHHDRDVLAARGYWQAFEAVKRDVAAVMDGSEAGDLVERTHRDWYRELFQPFVAAGALSASALAGYRNDAVYLRGSRHVPPRHQAVRDAMPALFELLAAEPEPSVRAVLGHWLFGYIHPYPDGNGRMARFLMNVMLASGGYPWTIVRVDDRDRYLAGLDALSVEDDPVPFIELLAECVAGAG
ncbi:MAG: Fic family protein [Thermoleophilia bacterium]|nr:Fic family protein [Thermoleophilia bacterium]